MDKSKKIVGLRFILTQKCNHSCVYCHKENLKAADNLKERINENLVEQIIREAIKRGSKTVAITGGEPFLSKDLIKLLKIVKKYKQYSIVNTNCSVFGKNIGSIIKLIDELHVHFPSLDRDIYKKITGSEKSLQKVLENLSFLKKIDTIKIFLNIPVVRGINDSELEKIYEFGMKNNFECKFLEIFPISKKISNYYVNVEGVIKRNFPRFKKISTYGYGISKYRDRSKKNIYTCRCMCFEERCDKCLESHYLHITPEMKIKPCSLRSKTMSCDSKNVNKNIDWAINYLGKIHYLPKKYKKLFASVKNK